MIQRMRNYFYPFALNLRRRGFPVSKNDRKLWRLKDKHKGQRAFIIGNGPSVKLEYLDRLRGEISFGMNQMYKCFGQTLWRPTYYALSDDLVVENYGIAIFKAFDGDILISRHLMMIEHLKKILATNSKIISFQKTHENYEDKEPEFSDNPLLYLIGGYTTSYLCFQLAWYMGIRDFITLGIDANYTFTGSEIVDKYFAYDKVVNAPSSNWFLPDYFEKGTTLCKPKVKQQVFAYRAARRYIENHKGRVRNAGWQSPLEVFERVDFDSLF